MTKKIAIVLAAGKGSRMKSDIPKPLHIVDGKTMIYTLVEKLFHSDLFEKILGRPLKQATQEGFFRIGLFFILSLMIFTTFNDLKNWGLFQ